MPLAEFCLFSLSVMFCFHVLTIKSVLPPLQGGIIDQGFTGFMLESLKKPRGFLVNRVAKTIGGENKVTPEVILKCVERLQAFLTLTLETLKAEFPGHDLLSAFRVFELSNVKGDGQSKAREDEFLERLSKVTKGHLQTLKNDFKELQPIAMYERRTGATSNFEAWRKALLRVKNRRSLSSMPALSVVLQHYGSWNGLCSYWFALA